MRDFSGPRQRVLGWLVRPRAYREPLGVWEERGARHQPETLMQALEGVTVPGYFLWLEELAFGGDLLVYWRCLAFVEWVPIARALGLHPERRNWWARTDEAAFKELESALLTDFAHFHQVPAFQDLEPAEELRPSDREVAPLRWQREPPPRPRLDEPFSADFADTPEDREAIKEAEAAMESCNCPDCGQLFCPSWCPKAPHVFEQHETLANCVCGHDLDEHRQTDASSACLTCGCVSFTTSTPEPPDEDGMLPEYDFRGAERGKYCRGTDEELELPPTTAPLPQDAVSSVADACATDGDAADE